MITVRIWFEKRNEASYISLLDMQRVMQRVLKRSSLPVWHTLGFNPHIYMTFTCPLSLGQESLCESVDVKTEAENPDFQAWQDKLNAIMPAGIHVFQVEPARDKASEIAYACYTISYPAAAQPRLEQYNGLTEALVEKKGKKSKKQIDLKQYIPALDCRTEGEKVSFDVCRAAVGRIRRGSLHSPHRPAEGGQDPFLRRRRECLTFRENAKFSADFLAKTLAFPAGLCYHS